VFGCVDAKELLLFSYYNTDGAILCCVKGPLLVSDGHLVYGSADAQLASCCNNFSDIQQLGGFAAMAPQCENISPQHTECYTAHVRS
jgi:hypothetical protein